MKMNKILLCTDMDRTIIPNGQQPEDPRARQFFCELAGLEEVQLAYVTGRHLQLLEDAIEEYDLPVPNYAVTDVGTKIYGQKGSRWSEVNGWKKQIAVDWNGKTHSQLMDILSRFTGLHLQEKHKQSRFKLSYYLAPGVDENQIVHEITQELFQCGVSASVVHSIDEPAGLGLIDVLPKHATKLHAIVFLQKELGYNDEEVIFAGDSGNDLLVLGSHIRSILVANASKKVRVQALQLAKENGNSAVLYLADNTSFSFGGNYSAGVVQGVVHYIPEIGKQMDLS